MPLLDRSSELARHLLVCGAALWNALGTRTETSARPWQGHWNLNLTMTLVSGLSCRVSLGTQTGSCESRMRSLATASTRSNDCRSAIFRAPPVGAKAKPYYIGETWKTG